MNDATLLYRQVNPNFIRIDPHTRQERCTAQAFYPSAQDQKLSVYDGDRITAENSWRHFTNSSGLKSGGVVAVTVQDCRALELPVIPDGIPYPEHVSIDFAALRSRNQIVTKAKLLRAAADKYGWQFRPDPAA